MAPIGLDMQENMPPRLFEPTQVNLPVFKLTKTFELFVRFTLAAPAPLS